MNPHAAPRSTVLGSSPWPAVNPAAGPRRDARPSALAPPQAPIASPARRAAHLARAVAQPARVASTCAFLMQLHLERRRAERSGRALSLVVLGGEGLPEGAAGDRARLVAALLGAKRETDTVAELGEDRLAVLCLDTDAQGRQGFLDKLEERLGGERLQALAPQAATFPDRLFELVAGTRPSEADGLLVGLVDAAADAPPGYRGKRALDLLLGLLALLLLAPLMLLAALAIALDSPGPVIYRQCRLGLGGRAFTFYKFRSMHVGIDERIHRDFVLRMIDRGEAETPPAGAAAPAPYKLSADARITRVGRFIRRTSIDELPQLFNVLRGEMSLVGPRPPIPYEAAHYQAWHLRRLLSLPPGITGLWQVEGRSRVGFNDMVRMDLRYLRDCSLGLDLRILLRTVCVVLRGTGGG